MHEFIVCSAMLKTSPWLFPESRRFHLRFLTFSSFLRLFLKTTHFPCFPGFPESVQSLNNCVNKTLSIKEKIKRNLLPRKTS